VTGTIAERLAAAGITLDAPLLPVARYVAWLRSGNHLYISGQVSKTADGGITGRVGADVDLETGMAAARLSGINILRQVSAALDGDLDRVRQVVRLTGFVQATSDFPSIPQVMDGCSGLMLEIFGDIGRHTRSSVGVYTLPRNCAVEVDAIFEIAD
jgi:enamine deaminase RidA (YjgF/YER057c/UK114 family)